MIEHLIWLCVGLGVVIWGGDLLVNGSCALARRFDISPAIVGLTVVAFGTSAPELVVAIYSVITAQQNLGLGSVVGSNIANLALVLGGAALIRPLTVSGTLLRSEAPLLLLASTLAYILVIDPLLRQQPALLDLSDGLILSIVFVAFLYVSILSVYRQPDDVLVEQACDHPKMSVESNGSMYFKIALGCIGLAAGSEWTVESASAVATAFHWSPFTAGVLMVALGTSLPEMVTCVIAAIRGTSGLAIGNVIGSNLFNTLLVLPILTLGSPIAVSLEAKQDLLTTLVLTGGLIVIMLLPRRRIDRLIGGCMCVVYVLYSATHMGS